MYSTLMLSLSAWMAVTPSLAQDTVARPDFTGTWTLVAQKSDTGDLPVPTMVVHIKHTEPILEISGTTNGRAIGATRVEIGGKQVTVDSACCGTGTVKYEWKGQSLVSEFRWSDGVQADVRTLSPDGKTLTDVRTISQGGDADRVLKLVFARDGQAARDYLPLK